MRRALGFIAGLAELVDALRLGRSAARCLDSSLEVRTFKFKKEIALAQWLERLKHPFQILLARAGRKGLSHMEREVVGSNPTCNPMRAGGTGLSF